MPCGTVHRPFGGEGFLTACACAGVLPMFSTALDVYQIPPAHGASSALSDSATQLSGCQGHRTVSASVAAQSNRTFDTAAVAAHGQRAAVWAAQKPNHQRTQPHARAAAAQKPNHQRSQPHVVRAASRCKGSRSAGRRPARVRAAARFAVPCLHGVAASAAAVLCGTMKS